MEILWQTIAQPALGKEAAHFVWAVMQWNQVTEIDGKVTLHDANKPPTAQAQEASSHTG